MVSSRETIEKIIAHRLNCNGIRATAKLCKAHRDTVSVHRDTVMSVSRKVGLGCAALLDDLLNGLRVSLIQVDELHTTVRAKQRHLQDGLSAQYGEQWGYVAEDISSRAIISFWLGKKTAVNTRGFVGQLQRRVLGTPQASSDGYRGYLAPFRKTGWHYGQVVKDYEGAYLENSRHVADYFVRSTRTAYFGEPAPSSISTVHIERLMGTLRGKLSKFVRRTHAFAKSWVNLFADFALFVAHYNLVDVHSKIKSTPFQRLGITDGPWSLPDLIEFALARPTPDYTTECPWAVFPSEPPLSPHVPITVRTKAWRRKMKVAVGQYVESAEDCTSDDRSLDVVAVPTEGGMGPPSPIHVADIQQPREPAAPPARPPGGGVVLL